MRETVVHGSDVGKAAARTGHCKRRAAVSAEEKQPRIFQARVGFLFLVGINIVKNALVPFRVIFQIVADLHRLVRVHVRVPCHGKVAERGARDHCGIPYLSDKERICKIVDDRHDLTDDRRYDKPRHGAGNGYRFK